MASLALADDAADALALDALADLDGLMASPLSCAERAITSVSVDALAAVPGSAGVGAGCVDRAGSDGACLVGPTLGTVHPPILPFNATHDAQICPFSGDAWTLVVWRGADLG
ncbi:hypothetical protein XbrCFBP1976_21495 [Xanthomonas bromi]|uniref:Uncharacterized protein n=1 Tax=Xanthomonas bromi TaxID=56449 RepID=A0ABX5BLE8_9XANT|nr:hypothetical protein XbrCFBP1976_21495 [Xanthomonas bromi]